MDKKENQINYYQIPIDLQVKFKGPECFKSLHGAQTMSSGNLSNNKVSFFLLKLTLAIGQKIFLKGPRRFLRKRGLQLLEKPRQGESHFIRSVYFFLSNNRRYKSVEVKDDLKDSLNSCLKGSKQKARIDQKLVRELETWKYNLKKSKKTKKVSTTARTYNMTKAGILKMIG